MEQGAISTGTATMSDTLVLLEAIKERLSVLDLHLDIEDGSALAQMVEWTDYRSLSILYVHQLGKPKRKLLAKIGVVDENLVVATYHYGDVKRHANSMIIPLNDERRFWEANNLLFEWLLRES